MPGADVEAEISVSFDEVLHGSDRTISLRKVDSRNGKETTQSYKVKISPGVREGQRIRLAGQGETGIGQGHSGDLFLRVRYAQHPFLRALGKTLYYDLELAPWEAVLGTSLKIQSLDGEIRITIPAGTVNGKQLRLSGLGLPDANKERGDLYVKTSIEVPSQIESEERELWEALAAQSKYKPRKS
jgi:curved DNA-binding protein